MELPAKGEPMPQTTEQFHRMGDLYQKALIKKDLEIGKLKIKVNGLESLLRPLLDPADR